MHVACRNSAPFELISKLIDVGGNELLQLAQEYETETAIQAALMNDLPLDSIAFLMEKSVAIDMECEYNELVCFGHMFDIIEELHKDKWEEVVIPMLTIVMESIREKDLQPPPLLQAAILGDAPASI